MSEDLNRLFVLLDGGKEEQSAVSSDVPTLVDTDESLQTVYVTSLLLVEPKPTKSSQNRIEQVVGDDLKVEERLQVLDAMLPPPPERSSHRSKGLEFFQNKDSLTSDYKCELCSCSFQQPEQYFGHLQTHSGEHLWECSSCPSGQSVFESLSKLRQHEKLKHINPLPPAHQCSLCPASYERASQLESHHRRVHIEEKNHVCRLCSKAFYKRSDLRTHLRLHLGLQSRVCEVCGRSFSHVSNLIRHSRLHTGVKPYPCSQCGRRFTQLTALEEHRQTHLSEGERPAFPCPVGLCSRDFRSRSIALRHARRLHPEATAEQALPMKMKHQRRYHCAVCGETFEKASLLHSHEGEHEDYSCSSCNEAFPSIAELKAHGCSGVANPLIEADDLAEQTTQEITIPNFVENLADVQQDVPTSLESFLIGSILVCVDNGTMKMEAPEEFSTDDILQLASEGGLALTADDLEDAQAVITGETSGELSAIPEADDSPPFHLSGVQGQDSLSPILSPSSSPALSLSLSPSLSPANSPPLVINNEAKVLLPSRKRATIRGKAGKARGGTCTECGKHFRKSSNLKQHMGIHFADKQLYRCHICYHSFAWKSSLNKHLPRHFPDMIASQKGDCPDCGKEYSTPAQLHQHIRRDHLLERAHACQLCAKAFYKKHDLATHMRVHSKEKPYMCGTCGKTFTHVSHVKRHELIHRGVKRFECDTCQARFRQSSGLKAHVRRHHAQACLNANDLMEELCAIVGDVVS